MNKEKVFIVFGITLVLIISLAVILTSKILTPDYPYTQEYIIGAENIKGKVNIKKFSDISSDFEIGANANGYAVFKNPRKAFKTLKKEYKAGIKLIKKEFKLGALSQFNYEKYKTFGWQVTTGTKEEQAQANFVSSFLDIYENSYK